MSKDPTMKRGYTHMSEEVFKIPLDKDSTYVLALDVERLGQNPQEYSTIEIAAAVVCPYPLLTVLDAYTYSEYRSEPEFEKFFRWEQDCREEFWSKNESVLKAIEAATPKDIGVEESRFHMISGFVDFVKKWQQKSKDEGFTLEITTDNKICDAWTINMLIGDYLPVIKKPLPYSFLKLPKYLKIFETNSMIRGFLMGAFGKEFVERRNKLEDAMAEKYQWPEIKHKHDHRSVNDAMYIATVYQLTLATARGEIERKSHDKGAIEFVCVAEKEKNGDHNISS